MYLKNGDEKINTEFIENEIGKSVDEAMLANHHVDEASLYLKLFTKEGVEFLNEFYFQICNQIKKISFAESAQHLSLLMFMQEIFAAALWKYNLNIGEVLERFTREFDRLDLIEEKVRLYLLIKED